LRVPGRAGERTSGGFAAAKVSHFEANELLRNDAAAHIGLLWRWKGAAPRARQIQLPVAEAA